MDIAFFLQGLLVAQEHRLGLFQCNPVLGAPGAGEARHHGPEVQLDVFAVLGTRIRAVAPHAGRLGVSLDQCDLLRTAPGEFQVADGLLVDGENAAGRAVLGRHVGDRRAVCQGQAIQTLPVEFDELPDHAVLAQHFHHDQHQVGGRRAFRQPAIHPESDHPGDQHGNRLVQHGGLGLDPADPPAQHADPVDHGGVGVCADHRVRVGLQHPRVFPGENDARQVFEVDLVHDPPVRRDDLEIGKCVLSPLQKVVTLAVAVELERGIQVEGLPGTEVIDLHGVIDDQFCRLQWIDFFRISAQRLHGIAHGRQVDHGRDAREVLHQHARRAKGNLVDGVCGRVPVQYRLDVFAGHGAAIFTTQQVFQKDLERIGQAGRPGQLAHVEDLVTVPVHRKAGAGIKTVVHANSSISVARMSPWEKDRNYLVFPCCR